MKKVIIVFDDWNGGEIRIYHAKTIEKALQAFCGDATKATTIKGLLSYIQKTYSEDIFVFAIIADGQLIYTGLDPNVYEV